MKKGSSLKNVSGLKRCVIGVIEKNGEYYCREMHKKGKIKNYKVFSSTVELYKALAADKVDVIIVGRNIALYFQRLHPGIFKFSGSVFNHCEYEGFPIQKKQEWLLKRVNDGLRRIMNNGEYSRIYRKYFLSEGERICN
jgi:ABC-type amino acid transport substrate-binding protein